MENQSVKHYRYHLYNALLYAKNVVVFNNILNSFFRNKQIYNTEIGHERYLTVSHLLPVENHKLSKS